MLIVILRNKIKYPLPTQGVRGLRPILVSLVFLGYRFMPLLPTRAASGGAAFI
jgi:hypothetical protein